MHTVFFSLGSNIGERASMLQKAIERLEKFDIKIVKKSSMFRTAPWGEKKQPEFFNQVVEAKTDIPPKVLIRIVKEIEIALGRKPREKWREREIDIDILFYGSLILKSRELKIPHPFLHERLFVLHPLCQIAPKFVHPVFGESMEALLKKCPDISDILKLSDVAF